MSVEQVRSPSQRLLPDHHALDVKVDSAVSLGVFFQIYVPPTPASAAALPAAVLLHGMFGSGAEMKSIALALSCHGSGARVVLVPDLPYHARSSKAAPHNPAALASLLVRAARCLLERLTSGVPHVVVVGYSLGGRIALEIAAMTDRWKFVHLEAIVLISSGMPPQGADETDTARSRHASLAARLRAFASFVEFRQWLQDTWYETPMWGSLKECKAFPGLVQAKMDALNEAALELKDHPGPFESLARAAEVLGPSEMTSPLSQEMFSNIKVLYLHGERDAKYAHVARVMRSLVIPSMEIAMVPTASHSLIVEQPDLVACAVSRFLASVVQRGPRPFHLQDIHVHPYQLALRSPIKVGNAVVDERLGLLVGLKGSSFEEVGVGDIAPLPGLHTESISDCLAQVRAWARKWLDHCEGGNSLIAIDCIEGAIGMNEVLSGLFPSVQAGLSAAIIQCVARANNVDVVELLRSRSGRWTDVDRVVLINGVAPRTGISCSESDAVARASDLLLGQPNATVLKLKVGGGELVSDIAIIRLLADNLRNKKCLLRPDANCSWSKDGFIAFCVEMESFLDVIEYIEEPFAVERAHEMIDFCSTTRREACGLCVRIGLDESLAQFPLEDSIQMINLPCVAAAVLKPAVQGNYSRVEALAAAAQRANKKVILSSVFESGVGLSWTAVLACVLGHPNSAHHGIGTYTALADDCIHPSFKDSCITKNGAVDICLAAKYLQQGARFVFDRGVDLKNSSLDIL
jgi:o-succinylbenzoate synthase